MDVTATHSENYQALLDAGLPQKVAESLDNIFQTGETSGPLKPLSVTALRRMCLYTGQSGVSLLLQ
uniref:Uncharacterized protein n=1 Tax=Cyprinus carpio TaxID=7962 RepID=A0A8C2JFZ0_CYPCA